MWEKITAFLLSNLLPASLIAAPSPILSPPLLEIPVEPLASITSDISFPHIQARAALMIEIHSQEALFSKNVWEPFPVASLTKLMTALVVKEHLSLEQVITVSSIIKGAKGSSMDLFVGEKISVENLLKGLLIRSGNDAALILSEAVAGSPEAFVALMNERKQSLGLQETQFVDPTGLSEGNVSSAFEMAHLAKQIFKDSFFRSLMREKDIVVSSVDGLSQHRLINTNRLLGTDIADRIIAGKTGTNLTAGQCLISFVSRDPDRILMVVLLGSPDRYREMKDLITWSDQRFTW